MRTASEIKAANRDYYWRRIATLEGQLKQRAKWSLQNAAGKGGRWKAHFTPPAVSEFSGKRPGVKGRLEAHHHDYNRPYAVVYVTAAEHRLLDRLQKAGEPLPKNLQAIADRREAQILASKEAHSCKRKWLEAAE